MPRADGRAKVTGAARFTVDVTLPGMLHARLLRSPHPHAEVSAVDTSAAERQPDVRAVHLITSVVGRAIESAPGTVRAQRRVLYVGDPIAAVAATHPREASAALDLIRVEYRPLPFVVDIDDARAADAPLVFDGPVHGESYAGGAAGRRRAAAARQCPRAESGRLARRRGAGIRSRRMSSSKVNSARRCRRIAVSRRTPWWPTGGRRMLTVYMSTQYAAGVRNELAAAFGLPRSRVRVIVEAMGGGFGSKSSAGNYARAAVALSRIARAPVRLVLDRDEEQLDSGNRPATRAATSHRRDEGRAPDGDVSR